MIIRPQVSFMKNQHLPSFTFLFLLISFGSVGAVLFTPSLPELTHYFNVSQSLAGLTVTIFLIGYALGQLLYGPLANGYGRKIAITIGIVLEIIGSLACVVASPIHSFVLLLMARLLMALGSSVGLNMTFTLVADSYDAATSKKIIAYLMMAFAITPGLGIALGGFLTEHGGGWQSCFYASALYGLVLLIMLRRTQETATIIDKNYLQWSSIFKKYSCVLNNLPLITGSLIIGVGTACVYSFAAIAPFLSMHVMHMRPSQYGLWNLVPAIGILTGSHLSAHYASRLATIHAIGLGLSILGFGTCLILGLFTIHIINPFSLFMPMAIIYIGMGFIFSNVASLVMQSAHDKSSASAMMSFLNIGNATACVLIISSIPTSSSFLLPISYLFLTVIGFGLFMALRQASQ